MERRSPRMAIRTLGDPRLIGVGKGFWMSEGGGRFSSSELREDNGMRSRKKDENPGFSGSMKGNVDERQGTALM